MRHLYYIYARQSKAFDAVYKAKVFFNRMKWEEALQKCLENDHLYMMAVDFEFDGRRIIPQTWDMKGVLPDLDDVYKFIKDIVKWKWNVKAEVESTDDFEYSYMTGM